MMSTDDFSFESARTDIKEQLEIDDHGIDSSKSVVQRKKIRIMSDEEPKEIDPPSDEATALVPDDLLSGDGSVCHADDEELKSKTHDPSKLTGGEYDNEGQTHR